jgi:hypothetical protein
VLHDILCFDGLLLLLLWWLLLLLFSRLLLLPCRMLSVSLGCRPA